MTKLPEQVQEAVLQQFFEKLGAVEAVQVHSEQGEATITFTNAAVRVATVYWSGQATR